ncbi:MAG: hydrogen peroxide-inducible genes activator [Planctomycetota bacterium]
MRTDIEFQQLAHFQAVAKAKNFTKAAAELGLSQPSLSRSIQKLEAIVGEPLFERHPRGVKLTEIGTFFLVRANQIRDLVDDTFSELDEASNRGQIRLAVIPTIAPYLLPKVLRKFGRRHPDIKIQVQEDTTENIVRLCRDGDIDLAIVALPINEKYLEVESLFEDELILVIPKGHELEKKRRVRLTDIQDFPFITLDRQHCLSDNIAEFCNQESFAPVTIERTNQLATIQELVALQHGISIIPAMAQELDKSRKRVYRRFAGAKPTRVIALLQNPYRFEHRFVGLFKQSMREFAQSLRMG